jgi:hypothetical protein
VHYEATRAGLDPQLVLGLIQVESGFKKYAVSSAGARGYMQVMPFWVKLIGRRNDNLFHLRTNLRYGCTILKHYLDIEKGDLFRALGRYNGSLGKPSIPTWPCRLANQWITTGSRPVDRAQAPADQRIPMPGSMPFMPRISFCHAALGKLLHHLLRLLELVEQAIDFLNLNSQHPVAMRRLRLALIISGLARSAGVMELMMPSRRRTILSRPAGNCWAAWANWAGNLSISARKPAHLAHLADLFLEVIQVEALAGFQFLGEGDAFLLVDAASWRIFDQATTHRPCRECAKPCARGGKPPARSVSRRPRQNLSGLPVT